MELQDVHERSLQEERRAQDDHRQAQRTALCCCNIPTHIPPMSQQTLAVITTSWYHQQYKPLVLAQAFSSGTNPWSPHKPTPALHPLSQYTPWLWTRRPAPVLIS